MNKRFKKELHYLQNYLLENYFHLPPVKNTPRIDRETAKEWKTDLETVKSSCLFWFCCMDIEKGFSEEMYLKSQK